LNTPSQSPKPRPVSGIDVRQLPIGPEEAFVLSRVDGNSTAHEISYATSFTDEMVSRCLKRLESLGAIDYGEDSRSQTKTPNPTNTPVHAGSEQPPDVATGTAASAEPSNVPPYDIAELDAAADLETSRKQAILELYYRLDTQDNYQLLGIPRNADRRAVKAAYYEKVRTFHPDRYFGKDLGPFRGKLEECFARLTAAHDTLATVARREEYDGYLAQQARVEELERALSQTVTIDDLDLLEQRLISTFKSPSPTNPQQSSKTPSEPLGVSFAACEAVIEVADVHPRTPVPKMSDEDRKRFLARKLQVSSASLRAPPRQSSSGPSPSPPPPSREQIAEQLRRQLGTAKREEQQRQLVNHLAAADAAMTANDPVAASNSLRVAQALAPTDPGIAERLAKTQALASLTLSDTYLRQAEYEEKSGRFDAAARSYERAARGRPSPQLWESAARCLLAASGDLRSAGEFARMSIAMDPERAASHLILGRVFLAARMRSSAVAELERARRLDPNNDTVANLLKRIANDEI
jgi:tetratricopeptide (TPR) repeat protein